MDVQYQFMIEKKFKKMNNHEMERYIVNGKHNSDRNRNHKLNEDNVEKFSRSMWTFIMNTVCETGKLKEIIGETKEKEVLRELNRTKRCRVKDSPLGWLFFSERGRDRKYFWGSRNQSSIISEKYPKHIGFMVKKIMKNVRSSCVLTNESCLIPVYENEHEKLGFHQDKFCDNYEYVINIYFGDERVLGVTSTDGKFSDKLICKSGGVRVFHPLFNEMFLHGKLPSYVKRGVHYAVSIRESSRIREIYVSKVWDYWNTHI